MKLISTFIQNVPQTRSLFRDIFILIKCGHGKKISSDVWTQIGMPADYIVMGKTIVSKNMKCLDLANVISKHFYCLGKNADNALLTEKDKYWNVYRIIFNSIHYEPYWIQILIQQRTLNGEQNASRE